MWSHVFWSVFLLLGSDLYLLHTYYTSSGFFYVDLVLFDVE